MVVRTVKTNPREAEEIMQLHKGFIFRNEKDAIKPNDIIQFNVIKQNKPVLHRIVFQKGVRNEDIGCR